jgi:hypothetical protein
VPRRPLDRFEAELEDVDGGDGADRAESIRGVRPDPPVQRQDLGVRESGIRLGDGHQLFTVPDGERVVGVKRGTPPVPRLRVHQYCIDGVGLDLPLPPVATHSSHAVRRIPSLEHQSLDPSPARVGSQR